MKDHKSSFPLLCLILLSLWSALSVWFFFSRGWLLYYGDAEAHLNTARRIIDSQTPGYDQIGRIWLPLPHVLMLPFVYSDRLWQNGLAGSVPSAICFVISGVFLFCAVRRLLDSTAAAAASTALYALNPNLLYLQSTAMTEPVFFACFMALLYFSIRFRQTQGLGAAIGAGTASCLATLARYEGWFLIPFAAAYIFIAARRRRILIAALFTMLAAVGPLYWLFHNWWLTGDVLDFYHGPGSARDIQRSLPYPGHGQWLTAWLYFRTAAWLCVGTGLMWIGLAGITVLLFRRTFWPLALLALPGVFYLCSMHSAATPIFVPELEPHAFYNTRYGLAVLPLLTLASGALVTLAPRRLEAVAALLVIAAGVAYWAFHPSHENWITWKESQVNSEGRRQWTHEAAVFLKPRLKPGSGLISSFGDLTGIFRKMGLPLRETFTEMSGLPWQATVTRPDLFLWQEWAVVSGGDAVQSGINRAGRYGIHYRLEKQIITKNEPVIEIYRRTLACGSIFCSVFPR